MKRFLTTLGLLLFGMSCGGNTRVFRDAGGDLPIDLAIVQDLAAPPDLGVPDLAEPTADLEPPRDLLLPPDLVERPDLSKPVDLAPLGSCLDGRPCPPNTECCMVGLRAGTCYDPRC